MVKARSSSPPSAQDVHRQSRHRIETDPMSRNALQISTGEAGATLSPPQKRFNTLIRQIEQARQTLAAWHDCCRRPKTDLGVFIRR
jgi:hypothetical protein